MEPSKQVSYESALEVYRSRAAELFHKNSMLEARILDLEAQVQQQASTQEPEQNFGAD